MPRIQVDGSQPPTALTSGRIVIALAPRVVKRVAERARNGEEFDDLYDLAKELKLDLRRVLENHPGLPTRRLIDRTPTTEVLDLEAVARRNGFPPRRSLTSYWILDTRSSPGDREEILFEALDPETLASVDSTVGWGLRYLRAREHQLANQMGLGTSTEGAREWALAEPRPGASGRPGGPLDQACLGPAPEGTDAEAAWAHGYFGEGVGFVDLERGWWFDHAQFAHLGGPNLLAYNHNLARHDAEHGTRVLGIVTASHDALGIMGVAPKATVRVVSRCRCRSGMGTCPEKQLEESWDVAGAIISAITLLRPGDVLLLEVQTAKLYPIEYVDHCFDAIRVAVGNGITVIEPAGNGAHSVDWRLPVRALWKGSFGLRRDDSGAVMVGSCLRALAPLDRRRSGHHAIHHSSFGSRVDCYAWGEAVATTDSRDPYCASFGGTSAASAIVAGTAILTQEMHERATGQRLTPSEMRALLRDPRMGTDSVLLEGHGAQAPQIGAMPNLREIMRVMEQLTPSDPPAPGTPARTRYVDAILSRANRRSRRNRVSRILPAHTRMPTGNGRGR